MLRKKTHIGTSGTFRWAYHDTKDLLFFLFLRLGTFLFLLTLLSLALGGCGASPVGMARKVRPVAMLGHGRLEDTAWSDHGQALAVAGSIGVQIYDPDDLSKEPRTLLQGMNVGGWVQSVALSPDGRLIAIGNNAGVIRLRDIETGEERAVLEGHTGWVNHLVFSPDGAHLASVSGFINDRTVRLWDVATGTQQTMIESETWPVQSVAFRSDGEVIAFGTADGSIHMWHIASGEEVTLLKSEGGGIYSLAFSPDGRTIATGANDGTVRLWQIATRSLSQEYQGHHKIVTGLAFNSDGTMLASSSHDGSVRIWTVGADAEPLVLSGDDRENEEQLMQGVAWSPDGTQVATVCEDGSMYVWQVQNGEEHTSLPSDLAYGVTVSPDGKTLAVGSKNAIYLWDIATRTRLTSLPAPGPIYRVAFSPDGTMLASGGADATVRLWNVADGTEAAMLEGHTEPVRAVAFSPDGTVLASGGTDMTVRLWNVPSGEERAVLEGHTEPVRNLAFNGDGTLLASASSDNQNGAVWVWEVESGNVQHVLPGHNVVAFHPNQSLVASAGMDGTLYIWDLAKREVWLELQGHRGLVTSLAFNPDGTVLASGSSANFGIFLWNTGSQAEAGQIATLYAHTSSVWDLAFIPGEMSDVMLASASFDGSVRLWGVPQE
ncbi:MAG: hypothetical protein HC884_08290 [Chloroflexaceae bacterium]|nr:hypothetical protein [Chloroflexaceae bacterium]